MKMKFTYCLVTRVNALEWVGGAIFNGTRYVTRIVAYSPSLSSFERKLPVINFHCTVEPQETSHSKVNSEA